MSDILRPSVSHMFRSKASSAGSDKSETFRVLKVLINLICSVKQLVAYRWTALDVVTLSHTLFLTTDTQFFVLFFLQVYCRYVWFGFLRFQFGMPPLMSSEWRNLVSCIFICSLTVQPCGNVTRRSGNSVSFNSDILTLMKFCWRSASSLGQHL